MNAVLERVLSKIGSPLLEKQYSKVAWQGYGKWRTLTYSNGELTLRRTVKRPAGAKVVKNFREAREYVETEWGQVPNNRGRLHVVPQAPEPPEPRPVYGGERYPSHSRGSRNYYPISNRTLRISPRQTKLRR